MSKKGVFIDIEGLDGSGASTQAKLFEEYLQIKGTKTLLTKEPTDNVIGGLIRGVLTGVISQMQPEALQLLFCADRAHHISRFIKPALEGGSNVITDRYIWSTIAFGGADLDKKWLATIQKNFLKPDISFIIKVNPEVCVKRIVDNRFDVELFEKVDKLRKVWENYEWIAKKYKNIYIIDGEQSEKKVLQDIVKIYEEHK